MAEQTLVSGAPIVADRLPKAVDEKRTTVGQKTEAKKTVVASPSAKGGNKQKKLYAHLWVGLMMTIVVIAGYAFFGSTSQVRAAETAANQIVNIANNETAQTTAVPPVSNYGQVNDLSTVQAEMDAIIRQMESLQAGNYTNNNSYGNNTALDPAQIDQMATRMNQLVGSMNSTYMQNGNMSAPAMGTGHSH